MADERPPEGSPVPLPDQASRREPFGVIWTRDKMGRAPRLPYYRASVWPRCPTLGHTVVAAGEERSMVARAITGRFLRVAGSAPMNAPEVV